MSAPVALVSDPDAVTAEWLSAALATVHGGANRVEGFGAERIGTGQTGCNVRFELAWREADPSLPGSVVGKFPSPELASRTTGVQTGAYRKEVEFYRQIAGTVGIRTPACWLAAIDAAGAEFVLLMEDLAGSEPGDQIAGCDPDTAAAVLVEAARLHAPRWGDAALEKLEFLSQPTPESGQLLQGLYGMLWPGFAARFRERLEPDVVDLSERFAPRVQAWSIGLPSPTTVIHGDYRLDNLLFGRAPGAPPVVTVDWQTAGRGFGVGDVSYFLGAGLLPEVRRAEEEALLREYWRALCAEGVSGFSWDDCWRDYRHLSFAGLLMAVVASQLVQQTPRGDDMFVAMASRHGRHALDLEAEQALP